MFSSLLNILHIFRAKIKWDHIYGSKFCILFFVFFFNFCCKLSVYTYIQCSSFVAALNILSFNKIIWKTTKFYVVVSVEVVGFFVFVFGGRGYSFVFVSNFKDTNPTMKSVDNLSSLRSKSRIKWACLRNGKKNVRKSLDSHWRWVWCISVFLCLWKTRILIFQSIWYYITWTAFPL